MRMLTYSEQISEYIKDALINGRLVPGQRLNEVELASRLSISRAPVREALNLLVKDGLIVYIPQKGKFVRSLTPIEIEEKYFIGGVLEAAVVGASIEKLDDEDFEKLNDIVKDMASFDCKKEKFSKKFSELDQEFHGVLTAKTPRKKCADYGRKVCERMSKFLLFKYWAEAYTQEEFAHRHQIIIDALASKDKWQVEETIRKHYSDLGERMAVHGKKD